MSWEPLGQFSIFSLEGYWNMETWSIGWYKKGFRRWRSQGHQHAACDGLVDSACKKGFRERRKERKKKEEKVLAVLAVVQRGFCQSSDRNANNSWSVRSFEICFSIKINQLLQVRISSVLGAVQSCRWVCHFYGSPTGYSLWLLGMTDVAIIKLS